MDGQSTRESSEISLACNWAALTTVQQERQRALYGQLRADAEAVVELEDGYAFRHSPDRAVLLTVAEFVANERLCCPFFEFGITVERAGGPVWLRITGGGEAKRVLEAEVGAGVSHQVDRAQPERVRDQPQISLSTPAEAPKSLPFPIGSCAACPLAA